MVKEARAAGGDSPILFVFIPRKSPDELRASICAAQAAEQTIGAKGAPSGDEGQLARQSMESRRALAVQQRDALVREIVAGAMTDPAGLGVSFFAQDARLIRQLDALLQELQGRGLVDPDAPSGSGAITLYSVYVSWFIAYLANDAIALETVHAQVRAGIGIVMNGLLHPARPGGRARKENSL